MATAVLDVELQEIPAEIAGLDRYERAFILLRLNGCPVGQLTLPVRDGRIDGVELATAATDASGGALLDRWLANHILELDPSALSTPSGITATVAVCTRERPDDLHRALAALARLPNDGQEIIVVDNCPETDATRRVVSAFPAARYVCEYRRGLDAARNRALREAHHEVVAFIDDDAVPDTLWLRALTRQFAAPLVACATGLTLPLELETPAQEAFEQYGGFGRGFVRKVFETPGHPPLVAGPIGAGVNMAIRRNVIDVVGPFDEALDAGTPTRSGGDHEMFSRLLTAGYQIVYDPEALSWHRHRRNWNELEDTMRGYGTGLYAAWTRSLAIDREWSALPVATSWFVRGQLRPLFAALRRSSGRRSARLVLAETRGCIEGPVAYWISRRSSRVNDGPRGRR